MPRETWLRSSLLTAKHEGMVSQFRLALNREGVGTTRLNARDALIEMRKVFDPSKPQSNWQPRLPDDLPSVMRTDADPKGDISHMLNPPLAKQFFQTSAERVGFSQVDMGQYRYAPIDMTRPPERAKGFAELYEAVRRPHIPFRISFLLDGGGERWLRFRLTAASAMAILSHTNKRIASALEDLFKRQEAGEMFVRFRCSAATWGPVSNPDDVHTRSAKLESGIQGWGSAQTSSVAGDPLEAMMSSTLGLHALSTAPGANARLDDVLTMMPWTRQGSPWQEGSMLFMTPGGTTGEVRPDHRQTAVGCADLCRAAGDREVRADELGEPGADPQCRGDCRRDGGFALCARDRRRPERQGPDRYGARGLAACHGASGAARPDAKREASTLTTSSIPNPVVVYPLPFERESIVNIISSKCRREDGRSYESISSMIAAAVDEAYKYRSDAFGDSQPLAYQPYVEPVVDEALARRNLRATERDSWWQVVDALHDHGETHAMTLAQRHAVPLLHDLVTVVGQSHIADLYGQTVNAETGETYVVLFNRLITEMIGDLPILSKPTQFDIGEARVVVLDMQELCRPGGPRATMQTQIMYLVASHILAKDFMLKEDHLVHIPQRYKALQRSPYSPVQHPHEGAQPGRKACDGQLPADR